MSYREVLAIIPWSVFSPTLTEEFTEVPLATISAYSKIFNCPCLSLIGLFSSMLLLFSGELLTSAKEL